MVVYTTTFRGVRATYEECKYVLSVFHNLRVRAEERDIYVHKYYYRELEDRVEKRRVSVPQIFISGQHIGVRTACIYHDMGQAHVIGLGCACQCEELAEGPYTIAM